jgi:hypothetical protein
MIDINLNPTLFSFNFLQAIISIKNNLKQAGLFKFSVFGYGVAKDSWNSLANAHLLTNSFLKFIQKKIGTMINNLVHAHKTEAHAKAEQSGGR